jgi:hypothetical protein
MASNADISMTPTRMMSRRVMGMVNRLAFRGYGPADWPTQDCRPTTAPSRPQAPAENRPNSLIFLP